MHNFNEYRQNGNKDFDRLEDFVLPFRTCLQHGSFEWNEGGEQETEEGSAGFRALWEQGGAAASHFAARSKNINDSNESNHKIVLLCANFWIDYIFLYSMRKKKKKNTNCVLPIQEMFDSFRHLSSRSTTTFRLYF